MHIRKDFKVLSLTLVLGLHVCTPSYSISTESDCSFRDEWPLTVINNSSYPLNLGDISGTGNMPINDDNAPPYSTLSSYTYGGQKYNFSNKNLKGQTLYVVPNIGEDGTTNWYPPEGFTLSNLKRVDTAGGGNPCDIVFDVTYTDSSVVKIVLSHGMLYLTDR